MKTAVTMLNELLMKSRETAEYICIPKSTSENYALFEYCCKVRDIKVAASAQSKKEAKQKVAGLVLHELALRGCPVPPPFAIPEPVIVEGPKTPFVIMLKEICDKYQLPQVQYDQMNEEEPYSHLFTIKARLEHIERIATSNTKKMARHLAAAQLFFYLRRNLFELIPVIKERATKRRNEKRLERRNMYANRLSRPDLGMVPFEYHLGLTARLDTRTRERTFAALAQSKTMSPKRGLAAVADALRLDVVYKTIDRKTSSHIIVELKNCSPDLIFVGRSEVSAAENAMSYLRYTLSPSDPEPEGDAKSGTHFDWDLGTESIAIGPLPADMEPTTSRHFAATEDSVAEPSGIIDDPVPSVNPEAAAHSEDAAGSPLDEDMERGSH